MAWHRCSDGGAWIFYFADAPTLLKNFVTFQAPPVAYITVAILTATTYVFGGLMREQVCTYMCPWPRIQAAMLDEESLTVTYNDWRGEPRHSGTKKAAASGTVVGDCVDCNACVAVCPMGIDIRDGQQLECITCALCIDACDAVMDKIGKPRGLISYATLADYQKNMLVAKGGNVQAAVNPANVYNSHGKIVEPIRHFRLSHLIRPRTILYIGVWSLIGLGLLYGCCPVTARTECAARPKPAICQTFGMVLSATATPFRLLNMIPEQRTIRLTISGIPYSRMTAVGFEDQGGRSELNIPVAPDKHSPSRFL